MTYEIITVENGDVLYRTADREEGHLRTHRLCRAAPGEPAWNRERIALVEFGDDDRRQNSLVTYEQLAEAREAVF